MADIRATAGRENNNFSGFEWRQNKEMIGIGFLESDRNDEPIFNMNGLASGEPQVNLREWSLTF